MEHETEIRLKGGWRRLTLATEYKTRKMIVHSEIEIEIEIEMEIEIEIAIDIQIHMASNH